MEAWNEEVEEGIATLEAAVVDLERHRHRLATMRQTLDELEARLNAAS